MLLRRLGSLTRDTDPLELCELPDPSPGPGEIRLRVAACGVCHTELDEIEGRAPPPHLPVVLGHEAVGFVDALGEGASLHALGDRVGVGWIHRSTGGETENLSAEFRATGRDVNGGYAEYLTVPEQYAYPIPEVFSNVQAAPLLCAGAVGFRALKLAELKNGLSLGLTGFGGSAHLILQLARRRWPETKLAVFARDPGQREHAISLGADWAGTTEEHAPFPLDAIIDTTPAWLPFICALENLKPGGRLVINAIRKEDDDIDNLLRIRYEEHIWQEKRIQSVANVTAADVREFLRLAADVPLVPKVQTYSFADANQALKDLRFGPICGAKVLVFDGALAVDRN